MWSVGVVPGCRGARAKYTKNKSRVSEGGDEDNGWW